MKKQTLFIIIIFFLLISLVGIYIISQKIGPQGNGEAEETDRPSGFFGFLPFGGVDDEERGEQPPITDGFDDILIGSTTSEGLRLQQLTSIAISGATTIATTTGTSTISTNIRYIEKSTGNIFEINPSTLTRERLTNTTIPAIQEVVWNKEGDKFALRYVNENGVIKTFISEIVESKSTSTLESNIKEIEGDYISDDISNIIPSSDKNSLLYLKPSNFGVSGILANFDGVIQDESFTSPFGEWVLEWPSSNTITVTTKSSGLVDGYLYHINKKTGVFSKIFGNIKGLTTSTNPDITHVLYSESTGSGFTLNSLDIETHTIEKLSVTTLPEKCMWSNMRDGVVYCGVPTQIQSGLYPDIWYQGSILFTDDIWEIDIKRNIVKIILSPSTLIDDGIDIINPMLSEDEKYLIFTNKQDNTLWSLELGI